MHRQSPEEAQEKVFAVHVPPPSADFNSAASPFTLSDLPRMLIVSKTRGDGPSFSQELCMDRLEIVDPEASGEAVLSALLRKMAFCYRI